MLNDEQMRQVLAFGDLIHGDLRVDFRPSSAVQRDTITLTEGPQFPTHPYYSHPEGASVAPYSFSLSSLLAKSKAHLRFDVGFRFNPALLGIYNGSAEFAKRVNFELEGIHSLLGTDRERTRAQILVPTTFPLRHAYAVVTGIDIAKDRLYQIPAFAKYAHGAIAHAALLQHAAKIAPHRFEAVTAA